MPGSKAGNLSRDAAKPESQIVALEFLAKRFRVSLGLRIWDWDFEFGTYVYGSGFIGVKNAYQL